MINNGEGRDLRPAKKVYVQFADDNQVAARVIGSDADADIALLRVKPKGLDLRPLALGSSRGLVVGQDVAAIGSPFGERQSLSVGVITGLGRDIDSLTRFQVPDAIQTDAAINRGNSGGPLVDGRAGVVGVNAQISTTGGGNDGVGFAIPVDVVKRSVAGLRGGGRVPYAYLGVTTAEVYPQLARRFKLGTSRGAWLQSVNANGPADDAGLRERRPRPALPGRRVPRRRRRHHARGRRPRRRRGRPGHRARRAPAGRQGRASRSTGGARSGR